MGDHDHLRLVDVEPGRQPRARRFGHHHDDVGTGADLFEHPALIGSRGAHHGVGDDDDRTVDAVQQLDDRFAVRSRVDAVLVLHDDDIGPVQDLERAVGAVVGERRQHERILEVRRWAAPDHVDGDVVADECSGQRCGERGDSARGRGERRQDPEGSNRGPVRCCGWVRDVVQGSAPPLGSAEATGLRRATEPTWPSSPSGALTSERREITLLVEIPFRPRVP